MSPTPAPRLIVCSRDDAPRHARSCSHALSIDDSGASPTALPDIAPVAHHHATFDDIVTPAPIQVGTMTLVPPTRTTMLALIRALDVILGDDPQCVLIHCAAGRRRSPAAAYILYAHLFGPGAEQEALAAMVGACTCERPEPNPLMLAYADRLLDHGGRLLGAAWPMLNPAEWLTLPDLTA